ncbi:alpha/beta fold hydrolase [Polymorphum gilvum]|uniref:Hydrolase, alpha/beta fold family, putative n=1 Tax=Polymorphum gilvum (strain LMG 25793 / CGMCC 1.9160 / SL003B-26A1) TaxID=991905 RepID=F2J513_POLGS|nr:alpha/beta hydrolase [Polymorphum gilvum]ADZ70055.1 Hydrolase, alpha/beta fold family, putative [Polymorphum gilvum SL003B-26A1]
MRSERIVFRGCEDNVLVASRYGRDGTPVLLLHGGGQTRHAWRAAASQLSEDGFVAYALDQRGHGESDWVPSGRYGLSEFGADLVATVQEVTRLHGARPAVVGASLGGLSGLVAEGLIAPGLMAALVLVDITPQVDPDGVSKVLGFMSERVEQGFGSVEEAAEAVASYLPHRKRPKSLEGLKKNLRLHDDGRYRWHWDPRFIGERDEHGRPKNRMPEEDLVRAAGSLSLPVLLIRGGRSELVTKVHAEQFQRVVPHAQVVDVQQAGHMVAGDRNDVFAEALRSFLGRLCMA